MKIRWLCHLSSDLGILMAIIDSMPMLIPSRHQNWKVIVKDSRHLSPGTALRPSDTCNGNGLQSICKVLTAKQFNSMLNSAFKTPHMSFTINFQGGKCRMQNTPHNFARVNLWFRLFQNRYKYEKYFGMAANRNTQSHSIAYRYSVYEVYRH